MDYLAVWRILEEMIIDFRRKDVIVPADIMSRIRSAKTLINVLKVDSTYGEARRRVEECLLSIESYLVSEGQKLFGTAYVEKWLRQLDQARKKDAEEEREGIRFIHGVPRNQKWIRVRPSTELSVEELEALANESDLSHNVQDDGCVLVYGREKQMKAFVKRMTRKYRLKARE